MTTNGTAIIGATVDRNDSAPVEPVAPVADIRAGLACHPQSLEPLRAALTTRNGPQAEGYKAAVSAFETVHQSMGDMARAVDAVSAPNAANRILGPKGTTHFVVPEDQKESLRVAIAASFDRGARKLADANLTIDKAEAQIQNSINNRLSNPKRNEVSESAVASEIRSLVKGLATPADRMSWVAKQAKDGDLQAVAAVLSAHPAVSGLDREQMRIIRDLAEQDMAPAEVAEREGLRALRVRLADASNHYLGRMTTMLPVPNLKSAESARAIKKLATGV